MAYSANVLGILIASPGDVQEERKIVTEEIHRWNSANAYVRKLVLTPIKWETHTTPQLGAPPQEIINGQVLDAADILIGIFGTRLGTPTAGYLSGTVEEIKRHVAAGRSAKVYFSDAPVAPSTIDADQYSALTAFKEECRTWGLYAEYSDLNQFRTDVKHHLDLELNQAKYIVLSSLAPRMQQAAETLSNAAQELLTTAASDPNGQILQRSSLSGEGIAVGAREFIDRTARSAAKWKSALNELSAKRLIERASPTSPLHRLTDAGYDLADKLVEDKRSHMPVTLHVELAGPPNAQQILVRADETIQVSSVDYLTSSEACVASQPTEAEGKELSIPIDHQKAVELNNSPRPDRSSYDHSGPVKLRISFSARGASRKVVLPALLQHQMSNNTQYVTFTGSSDFEV